MVEVEGGGTEEKKEEKEKIIGHRPLWGRCPAPPSISTTTYLGRARVPLTIFRFCDYLYFAFVASLLSARQRDLIGVIGGIEAASKRGVGAAPKDDVGVGLKEGARSSLNCSFRSASKDRVQAALEGGVGALSNCGVGSASSDNGGTASEGGVGAALEGGSFIIG